MSFAAVGKRLDHARNRVGAMRALSAPRTTSTLSMLSRVKLEKSNVPPGRFTAVPSTRTLGLIRIATVQENTGEAAFRTGAIDGNTGRVYQDIGEGNGLALLDFVRVMTVTEAEVSCFNAGSACAVTTTLAERRSSSKCRSSLRDCAGERSRIKSRGTNDSRVK